MLAISLLLPYAFELARFLLDHEWPPSLFRFVKIFSIVLVASCERFFTACYERDPERLIRCHVCSSPVVVLVGLGERP